MCKYQGCGAATKILGAVYAPALCKNPGAGAVSAPAPLSKYRDMANL